MSHNNNKQNPLLLAGSNLFCFFALLDPSNNIVGVKIPTFILFVLGLFCQGNPKAISLKILACLLLINIVSVGCGMLSGLTFDLDFSKQYLFFFITLFCISFAKDIDVFKPILITCFCLSIFTIFGFIVMSMYPEIETIIYTFMHNDYNDVVLMSHRTFLGVDFVSFCHKSLLVVAFPASLYYYKFLTQDHHKMKNIILSCIFMFALFCGGNRSMLIGVFFILFILTYPHVKHYYFIKPLIIFLGLVGIMIVFMALSEKGESSNDVKFDHLTSYLNYFSNNWHLILFGSGAGSFFYSKGFSGMTVLTEWTYIEIIRMYGLVGLMLFLWLIIYPLTDYKWKLKRIKYWEPISLGYVVILIISGSNPYLMNSTGMICIVFIYSYVYNKTYRTNRMLFNRKCLAVYYLMNSYSNGHIPTLKQFKLSPEQLKSSLHNIND